jgi:serine/threonine protein kinase
MAADTQPERFGRYTLLGELGRGAMGVVYTAEDTQLGRRVALKVIALGGSGHERDLQEARFRQEARAAAGVAHPSIVTIYDAGREGDIAFIAMELVQGEELRALIQGGRLTPSQAIELAALVAEGLAGAHAHGVIHRDIKPGNIMVLPDGRVKVMDFGIARLQQPTVRTETGVLLGSPQYMSPEQVAGQEVDGRADIFSLGVVLYEMLTGVKPFDAADLSQVLFWVVNMPAKPPGQRRPGLPAVVDYIVARAMKKKPEERYASAAELASDLRSCLEEVRAAEAGIAARNSDADTAAPHADTLPIADDRLELRTSRHFDSAGALARLPVLPRDDGTRSRAGWTMPGVKRRRLDRSGAILLATYGVAVLVAIAIVVA